MPRPRFLLITLLLPALALWMPACTSERATEPELSGEQTPAAPLVASTSNTWTARAPLPSGACGISAGLMVNAAGQSVVYVFGGTPCQEGFDGGEISAYNVTTNTWTLKGSGTATRAYMNGVGKIGGRFYMSGGLSYGAGFEVATFKTHAYSISGGALGRKADMPKATAEGVTGVIHDKLYVLPGYCSGDAWPDPRYCETEDIRQLYRYDPVTNTWATRRAAPHFHREGAGGVINNKFYVVGGRKEGGAFVTDLDVYDPATNTWATRAPIPVGGPAIAAVLRGKLFVIPIANNVLYVYDPVTNTWKTKRGPTHRHEAATRVRIDGRDYLLAVGRGTPSELYTP